MYTYLLWMQTPPSPPSFSASLLFSPTLPSFAAARTPGARYECCPDLVCTHPAGAANVYIYIYIILCVYIHIYIYI